VVRIASRQERANWVMSGVIDSIGSRKVACGKRRTQEFPIFSKAGRLRMIRVEPFNCTNCLFLKSENKGLDRLARGANHFCDFLLRERQFQMLRFGRVPWIGGPGVGLLLRFVGGC
jgi:hypothetical protein